MGTSPQADQRIRVFAPLGHGGMSDVWLGSLRGPAGFEKLVAVKQLRFVNNDSFDGGAAFLREAKLAAMLNHPNVVQTFEVLAQGGDYRIVMEFLEGQPLNRILRKAGADIPLVHLIRVLVDVLAGLHYAHELSDPTGRPLKVVHRDVSPHNIFVTWEGGVKLLDFGIAAVEQSGDATSENLVKGKLTYMAPEQAAGTDLDRRADLFAVGVVLFEILAGQPMWSKAPGALQFAKLVAGRIPDIDEAAPSAPEPLRAICRRALAVDPADRFATALEMRQALQGWMGSNRPDPTILGELVGEMFSVDRARMRTIVAHSLATDDGADNTDLYAPTPTSSRPPPPVPVALDRAPDPAVRPSPSYWWVPLTGAVGIGLGGLALATAGAVGLGLLAAAWWAQDDLVRMVEGLRPDVDPVSGCPIHRPTVELSGNIDADADLDCARDYLLNGVVRVLPGSTLTVAPGTILRGQPGSVLVVEPGARIVAHGLPEAPVVMTSAAAEPAPGDWGGLVVLGRAPTNLVDGRFKGLSPEGDAFGGDRPNDDSGVIRYVRIEYAGMVLAPNNETNGLSLAGVGRGTVVDHVQVRHGADDCFEWFGGTVDGSHLVCVDPGDDGFDIEFGYLGELRSLVLLDRHAGHDRDRHGIEVDSDASGDPGALPTGGARPRTAPVIQGATLCATNGNVGYGLLVRRGAEGAYAGLWIDGYAAALDVRDHGQLKVQGVALGPDTPLAPVEDAPASDPSGPAGRADDDGGLDETTLTRDVEAAVRCGAIPVGVQGALTAADRWDLGWVVWD